MIVPILIFSVLAIGIIGIVKTKDSWRGDGYVGMTVIGTFASVIIGIIMICAAYNNVDFANQYGIQRDYIETISTNNNLTSEERVSVIKKANELNYRILKSRSLGKNIWIGWMFAGKPADYEIIDISKISNANQKVTLNTQNQ